MGETRRFWESSLDEDLFRERLASWVQYGVWYLLMMCVNQSTISVITIGYVYLVCRLKHFYGPSFPNFQVSLYTTTCLASKSKPAMLHVVQVVFDI